MGSEAFPERPLSHPSCSYSDAWDGKYWARPFFLGSGGGISLQGLLPSWWGPRPMHMIRLVNKKRSHGWEAAGGHHIGRSPYNPTREFCCPHRSGSHPPTPATGFRGKAGKRDKYRLFSSPNHLEELVNKKGRSPGLSLAVSGSEPGVSRYTSRYGECKREAPALPSQAPRPHPVGNGWLRWEPNSSSCAHTHGHWTRALGELPF